MNIIFKLVIIYYMLMNIVLFIAMGIDKYFAIKSKMRIPELNLFIISILGGALGGIFGMYIFRHKIRKILFYIIYSISFFIHLMLIYFIMKLIL